MSSNKNRLMNWQTIWKVVSNTAMVVLLMSALMFISFKAFPGFRVNVLNSLIDTYESYTGTSYLSNSKPVDGFSLDNVWVPERFVLTEEYESSNFTWKDYHDGAGRLLYIEKMPAGGQGSTIDTEDAVVSEIDIHGNFGLLIEEGPSRMIYMLVEDCDLTIYVFSEALTTDEILKVAESTI